MVNGREFDTANKIVGAKFEFCSYGTGSYRLLKNSEFYLIFFVLLFNMLIINRSVNRMAFSGFFKNRIQAAFDNIFFLKCFQNVNNDRNYLKSDFESYLSIC